MFNEKEGRDVTQRCWIDVAGQPMPVGELDSLDEAMRVGATAPAGAQIIELSDEKTVLATMGRHGWEVAPELLAAS